MYTRLKKRAQSQPEQPERQQLQLRVLVLLGCSSVRK